MQFKGARKNQTSPACTCLGSVLASVPQAPDPDSSGETPVALPKSENQTPGATARRRHEAFQGRAEHQAPSPGSCHQS